MNYDYDIIIIGGGPAGAVTALYAAQQGIKVLLVDRAHFPRDKVCGDAIPPSAIAILEELGFLAQLRQMPHTNISLVWQTEDDCWPLPNAQALVCKRSIFDCLLFTAAKAQVDTREGWKVENLLLDNDRVLGIHAKSDTGASCQVTAKIIVGADGCNSIVARKAVEFSQPSNRSKAIAARAYYRHLPLAERMEFYYLQECLPGYLWIFPVDSDTVNVGVIIFDRTLPNQHLSSQQLLQQLLDSPLLKHRFAQAERLGRIQGWYLPLADERLNLHGNGFILVGDAAGLIDPFMGHGIDTAMISGKIAGELLGTICRNNDFSARALQIYTNAIWQQYSSYFERRLALRKMIESPRSMPPIDLLKTYLFNDAGVLPGEAFLLSNEHKI